MLLSGGKLRPPVLGVHELRRRGRINRQGLVAPDAFWEVNGEDGARHQMFGDILVFRSEQADLQPARGCSLSGTPL